METFAPQQEVSHKSYGIGVVKEVTGKYMSVQFGKQVKLFRFDLIPPGTLTEPSPFERTVSKIKQHPHSALLEVYLTWLRTAGTDGVENDCGCPKNEFWNYTCTCRTLVKLYHRFSVFKDFLVNECGYGINDIELESGKHKTVLVSEPPFTTKGE